MSGAFLTDREIIQAIDDTEIQVTTLSPDFRELTRDGAVQPCSLDLSIGQIYLPPAHPLDPDHDDELEFETGCRLEPGHTVVVLTKEEISLSAKVGAFGFPPASVSQNAILMTNPGHVDPGFSGHLKFTLINMGRRAYTLRIGDPIVTLLLFRFEEPVAADYAVRRGDGATTTSEIGSLLNVLAPDFAAYGERIEREVERVIRQRLKEFDDRTVAAEQKFDQSRLWFTGVGALFGVALVFILTFFNSLFGYASDEALRKVERSVASLESALDVDSLRSRVEALENLRRDSRE